MKSGLPYFVGLLLVAQIGMYASGCTGSKVRNVSVKAGEYYSESEYEALPSSRQNDYCGELETEMMASEQIMTKRQNDIQEAKDLIQSIRRQIVPIEQEVLALESDIRSLNDQIESVKALPKEYLIKTGDTLTLIAMKENIYNDIEKWTRIFEANQDKIEDPYYIFPDTVLVIPRDWPTD